MSIIEVPEGNAGKNRIHCDLMPVEGKRDDVYARLLELGASVIADHRGKYGRGSGWIILADPEDNEFCIQRGEIKRSSAV